MHSARVLRRILPGLPRRPVSGPWYRTVHFDTLHGPPPAGLPGPQPLWPGGAARRGARFTPRAIRSSWGATAGIDTLYLAEDELTPLAEISGVLRPAGSAVKLLFEPQVLMTVDGSLTDILDLTDPAIQHAIGTTPQQLTGAWVVQQSQYLAGRGPMPGTQVLGQEAFRTGQILGLRYASSKNPTGVALAVFTARLKPAADRLEVFNQPGGTLQQKLP
jgi:RES domain-containing protein